MAVVLEEAGVGGVGVRVESRGLRVLGRQDAQADRAGVAAPLGLVALERLLGLVGLPRLLQEQVVGELPLGGHLLGVSFEGPVEGLEGLLRSGGRVAHLDDVLLHPG